MPPGVVPDALYANRPDLLTADIPSEGTMTARGVALVYAALLDSDAGLVSASRLASMAAVTFTGFDEVMGFESSWAFGYSPSRPGGAARPGTVFGMAGMNGSVAYADIEAGTAVAVLRNQFPGDFTAAARIDQIVLATRGADQ
jgi:CubicO group peptidase (beta-lactamase class C family)